MSEQLYSQYADEAALQKQTAKILEMFDTVEAGILKLKSLGIDINTSKSVKGVSDLTSKIKDQDQVLASQQAQLIKMTEALARYTTAEAKQIEAVKQVTNLVRSQTTEEIKQQTIRQGAYADLQRSKQANAALNKDIQLRIKLSQAASGSQQQLSLQYQKATLILDRLSKAQRESDRGKGLEKFAADLRNQIKNIEQSTGRFRLNVGNYANSLGGLFGKVADEIKSLKAKQDELTQRKVVQGFITPAQQAELDKATNAVTELEKVMAISTQTGLGFQQVVRKVGFEFSNLSQSGNQSAEFLEEFKKDAASAKDSAQDLKDEIKALSSDTRKLDLAVGSVSALASAFEAGVGAAALFGANTEDVQKITMKLVAVQSVANGIREVGEQITKRGTAANKAYNFVVAQGNILFGKGVPLAQRFGAALKGIVILAVIGFLIQLVQAMTEAGDGTEYAEKRLKKFNDELERNKKISQSLDESAEADFKNDLERLKRKGIERSKLAKTDEERAIAEALNRKEAFDLEVTFKEQQIRDLQVRQENANEDEIREFQRQNAYKAALAKKGRKTLSTEEDAQLRTNIKAVEDANDAAREAVAKGYRDLRQFKDQNATSDLEADATLYQKRQERAKEAAEREKKDAYDLAIKKQEFAKKQFDFEADDSVLNSTNKKIEFAKKAQQAEEKILQIGRKRDLDDENISNSKRQTINLETDKAIEESRFQLGLKLVQIRVDALGKEKQAIQDSSDDFDKFAEEKYQKEAEAITKNLERELSLNDKNTSDLQRQNVENFEAGFKTKEEFDRRKEEIELNHQRVILEIQIRGYKAQAELLDHSSQEYLDMQKAIAAAEEKLASDRIVKKNMTKDEEKAILDQIKQNYLDTYQEIGETVSNILGGLAEKRKFQIQEEIDLIDQRKSRELDAINASSDSEEKKAAKIKIIEANAQRDKENLERRKRQIDRQKAIFERSFKGFEIITDTIVTVGKLKAAIAIHTAALNPIGVALATSQLVLAIVSGAASLTALLATPLPGYWKGTDNSQAGPAKVAEKGPELGVDPKGKLHYWKEPTIANLVKGTKIYDAQVTSDIISASRQNVIHPVLAVIDNGKKDNDEMIYWLKKIKETSGIHITNQMGIETTAWYINNMKR